MRWTKTDLAEKQRCIKELRSLLKPGDTVHTVLRSVSRSGMLRRISPVIILQDGVTLHPDYLVAVAIGSQHPSKAARGGDGIPVSGCGMDMGFHLVYNLSMVLFPDGFDCIGEKCPAADHSNGDRNYQPHHYETFQGAYALRHRWL